MKFNLMWLKFGKFGEFAYFAKLCSLKTYSCLTFADILDKFAKLYGAKFIAMQLRQTLATPNFCRLRYIIV